MATWTLSDAERERLNCFPTDISSEDIITFFTLTPVDKKQIPITTNASNRLGFALQLCTLRYLGFCPDILTPLPAEVLGYLAKQLGVDPTVYLTMGSEHIPGQTTCKQFKNTWNFIRLRKLILLL